MKVGASRITRWNTDFDIDVSPFQALLNRFKDAYDQFDVEDALDCPTCESYPPEDPILTDCLCVYCMECFTELLANHANTNSRGPVKCAAYEGETIRGYHTLTPAHWESLQAVFDEHTEEPKIYANASQPKQDDMQLLWQMCQPGRQRRHDDGDHSRVSPDLGEVASELSSDGFDKKSDRSEGYETESEADEEAPVAEVSQSGYVVDPRHMTIDDGSSVGEFGDVEDQEDQELTLSEVEELLAEEGSLGDFVEVLGLEAYDGASPESAVPIVLTDSSQVGESGADGTDSVKVEGRKQQDEEGRDADAIVEEEAFAFANTCPGFLG